MVYFTGLCLLVFDLRRHACTAEVQHCSICGENTVCVEESTLTGSYEGPVDIIGGAFQWESPASYVVTAHTSDDGTCLIQRLWIRRPAAKGFVQYYRILVIYS